MPPKRSLRYYLYMADCLQPPYLSLDRDLSLSELSSSRRCFFLLSRVFDLLLSLATGLSFGRYCSSTSFIMFRISIGLFISASFLAFSCFWIQNIGSSYRNVKSSHFLFVTSSWKTCLFSFLAAYFFPVRYSSLVFCCWCILFPQSYIQSMRSRWERGMSPASTWMRLSSSLWRSSMSFLALSLLFLLSSCCTCSTSHTFWMFFIDPGCQIFLFRQSSPISFKSNTILTPMPTQTPDSPLIGHYHCYEDSLLPPPPNISPFPDVHELFAKYNSLFFHDSLAACQVSWSTRMTLCAGTCTRKTLNHCVIRLSQPLLRYRSPKELEETLVHEMIHAYLFITNPRACLTEGGHGEEFQEIMGNINEITGLNVSVFHNFGEEVRLHRKHIWRCNGPCKDSAPFFGYVKRATNRKPQAADKWFASHQARCGGEFIKLSGSNSNSRESRGSQGKPKPHKTRSRLPPPQKKKAQPKRKWGSGKTIAEYMREMNSKS